MLLKTRAELVYAHNRVNERAHEACLRPGNFSDWMGTMDNPEVVTDDNPAESKQEAQDISVPETPATELSANEHSEQSSDQPLDANVADAGESHLEAQSSDVDLAMDTEVKPHAEDASAQQAEGTTQQAKAQGKATKAKKKRKKKKAGDGPAKVDVQSTAPFWPLIRSKKSRHAFSAGEIVAGKVTEIRDGALVVDLFGKATAFASQDEAKTPAELPPAAQSEPPAIEATEPATPETVPSEEPLEAIAQQDHTSVPGAASDAASDTVQELETVVDPVPPEGLPPHEQAKVGEIFRGRVSVVSESGHVALYNRVVDQAVSKALVTRAQTGHTTVPGLVFGYNRGGFDVLVYGLRAFCPARGMALKPIEKPEEFLGFVFDFRVAAAKEKHNDIVVSRRHILEKEAKERAKHVIETLHVGQSVTGKVAEIRDFGLFVDLGGLEGLLHASELSYDRSVTPKNVAKIGDDITVKVLKVLEPQHKKERYERVSLSLKALEPDPWDAHKDILKAGSIQKGKATKLMEFGAFIELAEHVEGLLHITELGDKLVHADQALKVGDEVDVVVERVDRKQRRISLSKLTPDEAKAMLEAQAQGETLLPLSKLKVGAHVPVRVTKSGRQGLDIHVVGVAGKKGRGFISSKDMGGASAQEKKDLFAVGAELEVKIIRIERNGLLKCSHRGYLNDEEKRAVKDYRKESSKQSLGTLGDILKAKLSS
ncbi:MAG: S1 RNA-binding domain-containing protein [Myxococcales bacterium]|nr:MAG: S1 RNA-binding domain-containing protein [Myxococcales bacterium]